MVQIVQHVLRGLLAAMLPSPERERYARDRGLDAPRWSLAVGSGQIVAGSLAFMVAGLGFVRTGSVAGGLALLHNWQPGLSTTHVQGMGLIHWLAWFLHPASWPFSYISAVGLVRLVAFVATREAVGEPLVLAGMRIVQRRRSRKADLDFKKQLGPYRPDRVQPAGERELVVFSSREKPRWRETVTIEHRGRYYRCVAVGLEPDDRWQVLAYRLREEPPGAIIRRLVRYDGPGEG